MPGKRTSDPLPVVQQDDNPQPVVGPPIVRQSAKFGTTLCLNPGSRFEFNFGPAKARLILENLEAIKKFDAQYNSK